LLFECFDSLRNQTGLCAQNAPEVNGLEWCSNEFGISFGGATNAMVVPNMERICK